MDHTGAAPWAQREQRPDERMDVDNARNGEQQGSDEEGENAMSTDSSEEGEDDPEEERKIREGFIVDEDDEDEEEDDDEHQKEDGDEERHRKRHKRRKHRKEKDEEEEGSEVGELDEDDLELVEEFTGQRIERPSKSRLKRLRRAGDDDERVSRPSRVELDEDNLDADTGAIGAEELTDLWEDGAARASRREREEELEDDDDLGNFIEADEDEEEGGMGEAERMERLERKRAEKERRRTAGSLSRMAGLDQNALAILYEVFGDGTDYDWALGDEDEDMEVVKETKYTEVFEPSEIRSRMLTEDDDLIRAQDIPERMQLVTSSLSTDITLSLDPPLALSDLDAAAYWVALRLGHRIERDFFRETGQLRQYMEPLIAAVRNTLDLLFIQNLEVPFIATHKRDFIWHIDGSRRIELLSIWELWRVYSLGIKFRAFQERKRTLEAQHAKLARQDDYFRSEVWPKLDSMEAITDAVEWLSAEHREELQDVDAVEGEGKTKRPTRVSTLEMLKNSQIDRLVKDFCPPAREISRKVREAMSDRDSVVHSFLDDPDLPPLQHVIPYVDFEKSRLMEIERKRWAANPQAQNEPGPSRDVSPESLLEKARLLIAMELGKDPLLRGAVRDLFKRGAVVSCLPTEKGLVTIDENHPYYNFKYLYKKPITAMTREAQFLHMLGAEQQEHLITVTIEVTDEVRNQFLNDLIHAVSSDGYSETSKLWNEVRTQAVTEAVNKHFLPFGARWTREWLREEVEDYLAQECAITLYKRVDVKPYYPKLDDESHEGPARIMAISWGEGDPKKDAIAVVYLDETGRLRDHTLFDNIVDKEKENELVGLIKKWGPDAIIIGGLSPATHRLAEQVRALVWDPEWKKRMEEDGKSLPEEGSFNAEFKKHSLNVIYVPDAVARLYQHSKRATDEFGALSTTTRYCIGLARYAQSPLNEYAALGEDVIAITYDSESQHLIPKGKLMMALERSLVNAVNKCGVDINRAVHDTYYQTMLPFVCGFGPRKAQYVIRKVVGLGSLVNREQFVRDGIMTTKVWLNAAAFLRIPQDSEAKFAKSSKDTKDFSEMPDPLDETRLHPQDYELARKMAADALDVDEDDYEDEHPSAVVSLFMKSEEKDRVPQLQVLSLDDFAQNLLESTHEQKRITLDLVSQELIHPFRDNRPRFILPDKWEILTMLSGETERTLRKGLILSVQALRVKSTAVIVRLASNLEGVINAVYMSEEGDFIDPNRIVKPGQAFQAQVIQIIPEKFFIELASRPSLISEGDAMYHRVEPDEYFNNDRATRDRDILQRQRNRQQNKARRMVKHPNFFNMNSKQAEEYLSKQHRGDVVIRPSSKGSEHLAVTWKVDRGIYQHIDVLEVPMDINDPMAGYKYIVEQGRESQREFSDLDELIVNYVKAMARKVDELMAHDKYKHQSPEQLAETLTMMMKATPDKSFYAFCLNPDRPGSFNLMFKSNTHAPITTWPVKVTPEAYSFFGNMYPSVPQLCDAFKMRHIQGLAGAPRQIPGGMTPYGGRTPGGGGRTPSTRIPGQTPNPYAQPTPNPYAQPPMAPPAMTTPLYGQAATTGPQLTGYGMPPPSTPSWGQTPQQAPLPGGIAGMNPARAAMLQQGSGGGGGWGSQSNSGSGNGWSRR